MVIATAGRVVTTVILVANPTGARAVIPIAIRVAVERVVRILRYPVAVGVARRNLVPATVAEVVPVVPVGCRPTDPRVSHHSMTGRSFDPLLS